MGPAANTSGEIDGGRSVRGELPDVVAVNNEDSRLVLKPFRRELMRWSRCRMVVLLIVERNSCPGGKVGLLASLGVVGEPVHLVVVEPDKILTARGHVEPSHIKSFSHYLS